MDAHPHRSFLRIAGPDGSGGRADLTHVDNPDCRPDGSRGRPLSRFDNPIIMTSSLVHEDHVYNGVGAV
jgi:hypothetical protein